MLTFLASHVVSFIGLLIGIILARVAAEEIKPGKKYLMIFEKTILILIMAFLLVQSYEKWPFFLLGWLVGYFFRQLYLYLGIGLAASFFILKEMTFFLAALIFILGLPHGSLLKIRHKKEKLVKQIVLAASFFFLPLVLLLKNFNPQIFFAFSAGGLLFKIIKNQK